VPITLTGLRRYPVKSCSGEDLESAVVEPWGLAGDRRWMVVDDTGEKVTARETHELLRVVPHLVPGGIRLTAPGISPAVEPLEVREPGGADLEVQIWSDTVRASSVGSAADAWFSAVAGRPLRVVFLDDPRRRHVDPERSRPGDVVTFADAFPVLLASLSSLRQLNEWIGSGPGPAAEPLDIRRFRPNLVIDGAAAFAEDTWSRIRIGGTVFRVVADCSRCVLTTVHPDTIIKGHEPIKTLSRHRKWDGKVWFAVDLIPEEAGGTLRVGDEVEVLEATRRPATRRPAPQRPAGRTAPALPAA
jgi:uncharacterized protein YcbX